MKKTRTTAARRLLMAGFSPQHIADALGLHVGYVRKIRQRDSGRDVAWAVWREKNPQKVYLYRFKQNASRRAARAARRGQQTTDG